jgi:hypothetical protein
MMDHVAEAEKAFEETLARCEAEMKGPVTP